MFNSSDVIGCHSLFQSKDEPEGGAGDGRGKLLSGLDGESLTAVAGAVGMWETRSLRFPRKKGNPRCWVLGIFLLPSFPLPFG